MTQVLIRNTEMNDLKTLVKLWKVNILDQGAGAYVNVKNRRNVENVRKLFIQRLEREPQGMFVAEINGAVVGYSWATVKNPFYPIILRRPAGYIGALVVDTAYRRMGIGKKLIEACLGYLKRGGVKWVLLHIMVENASAKHLFEGFGFRPLRMEMIKEL